MKTFRKIFTGSLLLSSLLMACQGINQQASGALSFSVFFPKRSFHTLQIPEQTEQIGVAIFEENAAQPFEFRVLTRENARLLMGNLPVGPKKVMAFAVDAEVNLLTGALEAAKVESGERKKVELELEKDWEQKLSPEQAKALEQLLDSMRLPVPETEKRRVELSCGPLRKRAGFSIQSNTQNTLLLNLNQEGFQTQLLPPQTQYIGIAALSAQTQELLSLKIVGLNNLQVLLKNLPIGELEIFAFALDEKLNPLTGSLQTALIKEDGQGSVEMKLEEGFEGKLKSSEHKIFKALISTLNHACEPRSEKKPKPGSKPNPMPSPESSPKPSAEPIPEPSIEPIPEVNTKPSPEASPEPSPKPSSVPSPEVNPEPSHPPKSSGGSGGSNPPRPSPTPTPEVIDVGNGGGSIGTEITVEDGNPSPPPITVGSP